MSFPDMADSTGTKAKSLLCQNFISDGVCAWRDKGWGCQNIRYITLSQKVSHNMYSFFQIWKWANWLWLVSKELQVTLMEESCFQLIFLISTPNVSHGGLYVCVSQSSQVEILLPKVIVLGDEAFERWLGQEGGDLVKEIDALIQQTPERSFAPPQLKICWKVCHSEEHLHPTMLDSWAQMSSLQNCTHVSYL